MRKKIVSIIVLGLLYYNFSAQNIITWELLKNVEFDEIWSEEFQAYYMVPKFSNAGYLLQLVGRFYQKTWS